MRHMRTTLISFGAKFGSMSCWPFMYDEMLSAIGAS